MQATPKSSQINSGWTDRKRDPESIALLPIRHALRARIGIGNTVTKQSTCERKQPTG
jgi:hypothetical protein